MCKGREGPHESVDDVLCVGIMPWIRPLTSNIIHDLVLALTRNACV